MPNRLLAWTGAPWRVADRNAEEDEEREVRGEFTARGTINSSGAQRSVQRVHERWRRRRIRARVFALLVLVVSLSGGVSVFTTNRLPKAIAVAATAAAVPVALYLGLRRND